MRNYCSACCGRLFGSCALANNLRPIDGVAPASCRHVCRARRAGEMPAVRPARRRRYSPERLRRMRRESIFRNRRTAGCCGRFFGSCALANSLRRIDGVAPASCRHVCRAKRAGEMPAVRPARRRRYPSAEECARNQFSGTGGHPGNSLIVSHSYCIPRDAATRFWYSRALAMAAASSTVSSFRLRMTTRPPMITVSTSLALSAYASCA